MPWFGPWRTASFVATRTALSLLGTVRTELQLKGLSLDDIHTQSYLVICVVSLSTGIKL
jgi:hypothetical protein